MAGVPDEVRTPAGRIQRSRAVVVIAIHFEGIRCFSSSNQCSTTTSVGGGADDVWSARALSLIIRNRLPSGETSQVRFTLPLKYLLSNSFVGLPGLNVVPDVWTGTTVIALF